MELQRVAGYPDHDRLGAELARQVDIEAGGIAVGTGEVERRIICFGQKPDHREAGQIRPEDLGRSTFTVTSLGALGGLFATPVLNHPEVAILGIHRIRPTPVARDGQVVIRDVMHVSVTCDHRVSLEW